MQNSMSDEVPLEGTLNEPSSTNFNTDAPAFSYDEVFPALSQPSASPVPLNSWRIGSSTVTQLFVISPNDRKNNAEKFGERDSVSACTAIMSATNTKIEISAGKDQALTFLVTGKSYDVAEARRRITASFQAPASSTIDIPKEYHKKLLGTGGQKLRDLEKATKCKISVPNINDPSTKIQITGLREGVEKAVHEMKVTYDALSKQSYESVQVPKIYHPFICGGHNETLNKLRADYNVRINVPPPSVQKDEITIAGEREGVLAAKERIIEIFHEMEGKCNSVSVEVPKSKHKYVFGPKGSTIAEILQQTGVSVEMPSTDEMTDTITLRGPQEKLGSALTMVYEKASSILSESIDAPAWLHKRLRGKKGANIQRIIQDPKTHVEFKDEGSIRIEGSPEEVNRVKAELTKEIDEYLSTIVFEDLKVDPKFSKHIIGKGGANVNRLKDETGVEINISDDLLRIEGSPESVEKVKSEIQEMIAKMENEKEVELPVDHRLITYLKGAKNERMREIRDMYKQVQISFPNAADQDDVLRVRGPKDEVASCTEYMKTMLKELAVENYSLQVPIYKQFHRFIIGKGGANVKKIRDETGTRIDLPSEGEESDVIVITGREECVKLAKERIEKIQNEMSTIVTEEISIPPKYYTFLIGARGKLIQAISEECGGVQIRFPNQDSNSDKVIIRGDKEEVDKAAQMLEASSYTAEVKAKPSIHRFLIGKNGNTVKKIRSDTGARIVFPRDKDDETIHIIGKQDQVERAKADLEALIKGIGNTVEEEMTVDPQFHRHFVARRGAVINQISDKCGGVIISFPRPNVQSDKVILKGTRVSIEAAMKMIEEIIDDLPNQVAIDVLIDQKHHRALMGQRGRNVQKITSDFNVQIKFPDRNVPDENAEREENGEDSKPNNVIKIAGRIEDCEKAKKALEDLVPITIEMPVPHELHRSIIGKSGESVKRFKEEFDVHITVSPQDQQLDFIKVTGASKNVELAKEALEEHVAKQLKENEERKLRSFRLTLEIDPEFHSKIIGRGGKVIDKIRKDFEVDINLQKRGSPDESTVTIIGYEEKATAARDHLLSIVNELQNRVKEEIEIDSRVHSRLIGQRGRAIHKLMDDYNVDIKFPRPNDENLNLVVITGATEAAVQDAKENILIRAEEYLQDLADSYQPPPTSRDRDDSAVQPEGFIVRGGPWETGFQPTPDTESITDFPSFGNVAQGPELASWGPRR